MLLTKESQISLPVHSTEQSVQEEQDAAREEWFATRDKRIAEHEAKETRRKEQEKQHIEYWKDWRQFDPEKLNSQDSDKTK